MKDPLKSVEWMAFPGELKNQLIKAAEQYHKSFQSLDSDGMLEAEYELKQLEKPIHKALGINTDFFPENLKLEDFVSNLKAMMKTGYNIFEIEEADPLMDKINSHINKFKLIKAAAFKQAESNLARANNSLTRV